MNFIRLALILSMFVGAAEAQCTECMGFLAKYDGADDSKAAEKACKVISSDKDVQKACKKVVKDVLKKNKDPLAMCKLYDWCPALPPTEAPTKPNTQAPTQTPTVQQNEEPTSAPVPPVPTCAPTSLPTGTA